MLDIAMVMTGLRLKVTELNARALPDSMCIIALTFEVQDVNQLNNVRNKIRMISGVTDVVRSHG